MLIAWWKVLQGGGAGVWLQWGASMVQQENHMSSPIIFKTYKNMRKKADEGSPRRYWEQGGKGGIRVEGNLTNHNHISNHS